MPSPAAFGVSFASALRPATSRRRLGSYLEGDTGAPRDEHRQYVLVIKNVEHRCLDALGEALRHLLTVHGGREVAGLRSEVRCDGAVGRARVVPTPGYAKRDRHPGCWWGDWWEFSARQ